MCSLDILLIDFVALNVTDGGALRRPVLLDRVGTCPASGVSDDATRVLLEMVPSPLRFEVALQAVGLAFTRPDELMAL